ncbi:MAG TPA: RHS repeat-associated core domain-containing protein [Solirubrobacteraceae bacterium]|nr:RHS repeat-associated core domain-containing protein [Solirubrobacteraceae bacterium]
MTQFGSAGSGNAQFKEPKGIAVDQTGNIWVADSLNARLEEFTSSGEYLGQYGSSGTGNGQFKEPRGIAVNSAGTMWIVDVTNNRVEQFQQGTTHDTRTIYYTAKGEAEISACREHPEWANLPCETTPVVQPGTSELPELATTEYKYNVWDEPETTIETVKSKTGSTTRTKTETYDSAGRPETEAFSSTVGKALPTVTYAYNATSGAPEKQSTTVEGKTKTVTRVENKLGELESYTDADENKTTYEHDVAGRTTKTNDGKGTQTITFNEITGLPSELVDSSHEGMKFTATFDVEGNPLIEGYPNGMTVTHTYNPVDQPTALEYKKTTHCTEKCVWFSDSIIPSIHGQWLEQTSTFSHQVYSYDNPGRITQVQNTPAGKGCTTRIYTNDEDTNRTSLTTREPGVEGKCATEGGKIESHTYDTADRLTDTGIAYNTFGNITTLPATDAEGHTLTSAYYTDNQLATQEQNGQTIGYNLDPAYRTRETISTGKQNSDIISHYPGPGNTPAWTSNPTSGEWSRNILGIGGSLVAIQNNNETPELQITNLHGDIIAKAYLSETATELAAKADTSEFGVPTTTLPAKYSWLGAIELPTELSSGIITMGTRSYVPQLGRFLQPDPVPGGSANAYSYTFGDPINSTDPTGAYANTASAATLLALQGEGIAAQRNGERKRAEREAAERYAAELAAHAAAEAAAAAAAADPNTVGKKKNGKNTKKKENTNTPATIRTEKTATSKDASNLGCSISH